MVTTWRARGERTQIAFTGRAGGVSEAPYESLNLGTHVGDHPARVSTNRDFLAGELGIPTAHLLFLNQVHGADVVVARDPWRDPPRADAAVTAAPGLHLVVMVADCVPVALADDAAGVVGVAHAGRKGLAAGVIPAVLDAMAALGACRVRAVVGPSVCGGCYEVPLEMREEVDAAVPGTATLTRAGTPGLDLGAGVVAQLRTSGVAVETLPGCTAETPELFSYRRASVTGRFAGVAGVLEGLSRS